MFWIIFEEKRRMEDENDVNHVLWSHQMSGVFGVTALSTIIIKTPTKRMSF